MFRTAVKIEDIKTRLKEHNLRLTQQRIVIYKALLHAKNHPTADMIYNQLKDEYPSLSLATVYKTLDTFTKNGLIRKLKSSDESSHYDADLDSHNHMICTRTNSIMDYEDNDLTKMIEDYFESKNLKNFNIKEIQLNIIGETIK